VAAAQQRHQDRFNKTTTRRMDPPRFPVSNPLVNEVIGLDDKDKFNSAKPERRRQLRRLRDSIPCCP
jgi:hypothetical protein